MAETYEGWTILELMGHRRLAGYVREAEIGGSKFIRIDVPGPIAPCAGGHDHGPEWIATQFYGPAAIYCMTATTEEIARKVAAQSQVAPVTAWELRPERQIPATVPSDPGDDEDPDDDPEF